MKTWVAFVSAIKPRVIEHERIVRAGVVRLDLRQDRVEQIRVMNARIENLRRRTPDAARDQRQAGLRVNWRLVFREHDEVGPLWFSRGSIPEVTFTPRVRVRRMCTPSRIWFAAKVRLISAMIFSSVGNLSKRERLRGAPQAREMLVQFEDAPIVKSQSFPNRIATLHRGIERADPRLDRDEPARR